MRSLILAAVLALVPVSGAAAPETPAPLPVLGVDPLPQGRVVEHHADAISRWVEQRIAGAVLLNIDANGALGPLEPGNLAALKILRDRADTEALLRAGRAGKSGLFHEGNYVRAAMELGMVKEVVWVIPPAFPGEGDAGDQLKLFLAQEGFSATDAGTFRPSEGCYRGTVEAHPVTICGQERLPRLGTPVLLNIGVSFVQRAAAHRDVTMLTELRMLFEALRAARYPVRDAIVGYAVPTGYLPLELRWVGEAVQEILADPALVFREQPPERWSVLQELFMLKIQGQPAEGQLLDIALSLLEQHQHDPALLFFAAGASARHGGGEAALVYAEQACSVDPGYCVGLREIGLRFMEHGNFEVGERFFSSGERLLPGMEYGAFDKGVALLWAGRPAEARKAFEMASRHDGAFPSEFMIGAILATAGDRAAARRAFDKGLAIVEQSPYLAVERREVAQAIEKAVTFYREEGLTREAELLSNDPRLRVPPPGAAP